MKKIIFSISFILLGFAGLYAQHEISIHGSGGLSTLRYDLSEGKRSGRLGGNFGGGYHYFFNPRWALGAGVEFALYSAKTDLSDFMNEYMTVDYEGNDFEFRTVFDKHKEIQHGMMLQIPLMLQFQEGEFKNGRQFYAAAGLKMGLPVGGNYKTKFTVVNSGYYEYERYRYETDRFMGFGSFDDKYNGSFDFKAAFLAAAEVGIKWYLNENMSLYTGVYLDYGLNNILKTANASSMPSIFEYNAADPPNFEVNSVLNSQYTRDASARLFTDKVSPIAAGVTLRLAFRVAPRAAVIDEQEPVIPEREPEPEPDDDSERLAAEEAERRAKEEQEQREEAERARREAIEIIQQPINDYHLGQTIPGAYQMQRLDERIELLQQYPDMKVFIHGHTCDIGTRDANERVGIGRDVKAREYLISKGIDASRIVGVDCKRDTRPVVPNTNETNRRINRRVEIEVVEPR